MKDIRFNSRPHQAANQESALNDKTAPPNKKKKKILFLKCINIKKRDCISHVRGMNPLALFSLSFTKIS